ncbi:MAG TPA: hypothetical protein VGF92_00415 [Stellaceae bacterium]
MATFFWVRRWLNAAFAAFGSTSCSELAEIAILCLLGLIASVLVMTPGDQTLGGLISLCQMLARCS